MCVVRGAAGGLCEVRKSVDSSSRGGGGGGGGGGIRRLMGAKMV